MGRLHDVILLYTKGEHYTWNMQYTPYSQDYVCGASAKQARNRNSGKLSGSWSKRFVSFRERCVRQLMW